MTEAQERRSTYTDKPGEIAMAAQTETYLKWPVPRIFVDSPEVEYRNALFRHLAEKHVEEIAEHCTYLPTKGMIKLVDLAVKAGGLGELKGVGLEAGAGCGLLSAACATWPKVEKVYALEACEEAARLVIPKVADFVVGQRKANVVPVFGTFDEFDLPDKSLDFIVELHSYHHSHDLPRTLKEAARVLKPGGVVLVFDRVQPNSLTDGEVARMLAQTYDADFLRRHFYPKDAVLTRAENGEHEYREREWLSAFQSAGLKVEKRLEFEMEVGAKCGIRGLFAVVPKAIRPHRLRKANFADTALWLKQILGTRPDVVIAPRETTLFILRKP